ncbi:PEP-CTERM sorting domain-containing protein [Bowmanella sp. Y26]|uniref:PEP-CTERM sorting domain-containing protein n=1 Tax=Bowmanella yangjiangensis TaxID=2811230 RepID=UPI001BDD4D2F|nr:PEP-CTERM sorting domain-containing protein [Bowmanella yangjiangensis]MBT1065207.1 PEP-CTERM sorting domain-containing protein [Bowmanella yangjiangensis]
MIPINHPSKLGIGLVAYLILHSSLAMADFIPFEIRGTPIINDSGTQVEFIIDNPGDKAALGSNDINGATLGQITNLSIDRLDDVTRFAPGSGPATGPYLNFWITDGLGNFAVVANEPSNPAFQALYNDGYSLNFADLSDKAAKLYENADMTWLPNNGIGLTFADLASFTIQAPTVAELLAGWAGLGSGAPRELLTNMAYGVNWVFGDTLANYVSGDDGYIVANARAAAGIPEPATWLVFLAGIASIQRLRRKS